MTSPKRFIEGILDGVDLVIVDVGAAYGLPPHLAVFESLARVCLFEPEAERALELRRHYAEKRGLPNVSVFTDALAASEGERTLYVTNVPTGSSLLKPGTEIIEEFGAHDYIFPVREVKVHTRALADVLGGVAIPRADAVKLDVQGAELEVLRGLRGMLAADTLAVELEVGMPGAYLGQPGLGAVEEFMAGAGFRLYDLRLVRHHRAMASPRGGDYPTGVFGVPPDSASLAKRVAEADALYFRKPESLLQKGDAAAIRRLIVLMSAYGQFVDAYDLIGRAESARILDARHADACRRHVTAWHRSTTDVLMDSIWFSKTLALASRISKRAQRRLLGKNFARWQA
jgi:FkbM family methyltransferase